VLDATGAVHSRRSLYIDGFVVGSPRRMERIGGTGGLVMIGLGLRLAVAHRRD